MKSATVLIGFALMILSGCVACKLEYPIIKPVYPKVTAGVKVTEAKKVKSLQPTLEWVAYGEAGVSYDLAIFEAHNLGPRCVGAHCHIEWQKGKQLYYREGLMTTQHTIEEPLQPATVYCWSIRVRRGSEVTEWSTYKADCNSGGLLPTWLFSLASAEFVFKTPAK